MAMVCLCRGVSERKVRRAVDAGAGSIAEVGEHCGAGTVCFACHPTIDDLLETAVSVRRRHAWA